MAAAASGCQGAIMAPTEILAEQHHRTLSALFSEGGEPLWSGVFQPSYLGRPLRVTLLTGSLAAKDKVAAQEAIGRGEVDIAIGTHALSRR
jgi:ATP-dependent DNA helicase RecG